MKIYKITKMIKENSVDSVSSAGTKDDSSTTVQDTSVRQHDGKPMLAAVPHRRRGGDNGKRKPIVDDIGLSWCNCTKPKLTTNAGGRGQAFCLRCMTPWYH